MYGLGLALARAVVELSRRHDLGRGSARRAGARSCSSWAGSARCAKRVPSDACTRAAERVVRRVSASCWACCCWARRPCTRRRTCKVDDLCKAVLEDSNYKVRVQAALVLGKLGDHDGGAVPDQGARRSEQDRARHRGRRRWGSSATRQRASRCATCMKRESDPFVRGQAEKAVAALAGGRASAARAARRRRST